MQEEQERKKAERPEGHKKKRRHMPKPDEDDLDLIKSNTGIDIPRKKRLLKQSEKEKKSDQDEGDARSDAKFKADPDDALFEDAKKGESDEEMIDTSKKRVVRQAKNYFDSTRHQYVDQDKVQVARQIFDKKQLLEDRLKATQRPEELGDLEGMFDGAEIDDQFATLLDKEIAAKDIPERLQLNLQNRFAPTPKELGDEAEWIFHRLLCDTNKEFLNLSKKIVCEKIASVVSLFRNDLFDIPFLRLQEGAQRGRRMEDL